MDKGFKEVHTQNRLSILAACEDPFNVATYNYAGQIWPLPQTGQMWLEHELLSQPDERAFFVSQLHIDKNLTQFPVGMKLYFQCLSLDMPGDIDDLKKMEYELVEYLGFDEPEEKTYEAWQKHYGVDGNLKLT